ncbi:unnamed protein product [Mytilus edulis]|uniref:OTU domain-containing protein n=1 Tax=Mytilus edulis TaxID=6550 RepID=A0A8S3UZP9_MYTED|nr:unnamed protein product [Mytilus edulis]
MKLCTNLGLRFEKSSYPLYDLTTPNIIGNPKDLQKIIGDGNCFYRAISYAITGTETNHIKIRSAIVNHIHQLGTNLHSLLQHGQTCFSYVLQNQINIPGSWATEVEIFVASNLLRTHIFTYVNTGNNSYKWTKFDANYLNPNIITDETGIYLNHTNGNHYDIVLSTSTVHKTLPCGHFDEKREQRQPKKQESEKFGEKKIRKKEYMRKFMQMRRSNTDYAEKERISHQNRRLESKFKHFEVDYNKKRRTDPEFVAFEKEHNKKRRSNPEFVAFEKEHNKKRRTNPEFVAFEKEHNKKRRSNPEFVAFEKEHNKKRRTDPEFVAFEKKHNKTFEHDIDRKRNSSINKALDSHELIDAFHHEVSTACIYRCTSCDQLWFKESVEPVGKLQNLKEPLFSQCVRKKNSIDGFEYVCRTCLKSLKKGKLPNLAIYNKLNFPLKPQVLMLNSLEEKLVAPVSTFFQMRELPSGGQFGIQGNVVNVPADNMSTHNNMLPRRLLKLKRRLRYKSHVMFQNIRPQKCIDATKYLLTKPLFKQYVTDGLDEKWLTEHMKSLENTDWDTFIEKNPETNHPHPVKSPEIKNKQNEEKTKMKQETDMTEEDDLWSEYDDDFVNKDDMEKQQECDGVYDTMLYPENLDSQRNILSFAPSEDKLPSNMTPKEVKMHAKHYELIQKHLAQQMSLDCTFEEFLQDIKMTEDDYILAIRSSLKDFFYHVLNISKSDNKQFMLFLSGGAGVGKTRLTKCIYQALIKYYNTTQGENPNQKSIILAAPTVVDRVIEQYHRAIGIVNKYPNKAEIKFVECPTISFKKWNKNHGKFDSNLYIWDDNQEIKTLNQRLSKNNLAFNQYFLRSRKKKGKKTRYSVNANLNIDGIHPGKYLSLSWTKYLLKDTYKECFVNLHSSDEVSFSVDDPDITCNLDRYPSQTSVTAFLVDLINIYFCASYYPNCDENDNILAISIDVTTSLDGNISKWETVACKVHYKSTITTTHCRRKNNSAQYLFVVGVYNETVCLCDCVYFDKMEAFKNQTREKNLWRN